MRDATQPRLFRSASQWAAIAICGVLGFFLFTYVDLTPAVESDFFFSTNDPQFLQSREIQESFGSAQQVWIAAHADKIASKSYLIRIRDLTSDIAELDGVADARSISHGPEEPGEIAERDAEDVFEDLEESPFWSRLLLTPDRSASFVVVRLEEGDHRAAVEALDRVVARHARPEFHLAVSGVPYVSEHIRERLTKDLQTFSVAAFLAFAALIGLLFRSWAVLVGTMVAALTASFATFLIRAAFGMTTDVLAPNLWTIAFALTLSHVVYLTAEWRSRAREAGVERAIRESVRLTGPASAWSLTANLLGFASLIFVSAKPLRAFGISGGIAALAAIAAAYGLFPRFLRSANPGKAARRGGALERFFTRRHPVIALTALAATAIFAPFAWRVNSDPSLPTYFAEGSAVRSGLEAVDRVAGSSPLDLVVADASRRELDNSESFDRLKALQQRLERQKDVGSVLSIALLMEEADRPWYSFLFSWERKIETLGSPEHDRIGSTFLSEDSRRGRFILRMHEESRARPREAVVNDIKSIVRDTGFEPVLVGGLYPLQGELSRLVEGSIVRGLGGLVGLFFVIVLIVTRSLRTSLSMGLCLAITPFALFGAVGWLGMPTDIISAPAANVALPLGVDEMIHLGYAVRRRYDESGASGWSAWRDALRKLWAPVVASMVVVVSGFSLFLLSGSPPTQRLGVLVCAGAALTDLVVLVVLPALAAGRRKDETGRPEPESTG